MIRLPGTSVLCLITLAGCNGPPLYHTRAREFLISHNVPASLVEKLVEIKPLTAEEAERLFGFENVAVLHLLASNPSISQSLIRKLAERHAEEVRAGLAVNPKIPLPLLLSYRTRGRYTTLNESVARNPQLSTQIIYDMYENREASLTSLGLNPSCPSDLMRKIAHEGSDIDRAWLATNPNLPSDLFAQLENDNSESVRSYAEINPTYGKRARESNPDQDSPNNEAHR